MNKKALPSVEPSFNLPGMMKGAKGACCPSCRRPQFPPAGAGHVVAKCPALGRLAPSVGGFSPHALRPFVGQRGRLSCRVSGLSCRSRRSTLGLLRVGAGACRPRLWLAACRGLRWACRFSVGRITLNYAFRIIRLFLPSVAGSLAQSHGELQAPASGGPKR